LLHYDQRAKPDDFAEFVGCALLFWAAEKGYCQVIRLLLDMGVPVDSKNSFGATPLHVSLRFHEDLAAQTLLICGANPAMATSQWHISGNLKIATSLCLWLHFTDWEVQTLQALLKAGANVNESLFVEFDGDRDKDSGSLLHWFSRVSPYQFNDSHERIMTVLVQDRHVNVNVQFEPYRTTPLIAALEAHNPRAIKLLLHANADPNLPDSSGRPPLSSMCQNDENISCVKLLLAANANPQGNDLERPLIIAAESGSLEILRALLDAGADISVREKSSGDTALHRTFYKFMRRDKVTEFLLNAGAEVEARNSAGETPFFVAAKRGCFQALQMLIAIGVDVNAQDNFGRTPLFASLGSYWIAEASLIDCVNILLFAGADVTIRSKEGETAIDIAFAERRSEDRVCRILFRAWARSISRPDLIKDSETAPLDVLEERYWITKRSYFGADLFVFRNM
jgi:ankyrin repeat protein